MNDDIPGLVFIDGDANVGNAQIADYVSYGPNNEVYLAKNQKVAFLLSNVNDNVAGIHIGVKSAKGNSEPCSWKIENIARNSSADNKVSAGDPYHEQIFSVETTTDMYYDITTWKNDIIVISNEGEDGSIISLTNIKATYKTNPNEAVVANEGDDNNGITVASEEVEISSKVVGVYMTPNAATLTLRTLNASDEEEIPEVTEPEESIPEPSVPEETDPIEPTEPVETEPEQTEPEETKPNNDNNVEQALKNVLRETAKALKKLFGGWFR